METALPNLVLFSPVTDQRFAYELRNSMRIFPLCANVHEAGGAVEVSASAMIIKGETDFAGNSAKEWGGELDDISIPRVLC